MIETKTQQGISPKGMATGAAIGIGLVALLIGAGAGFAAGNSSKTTDTGTIAAVSAPTADTKAADLRVLLNGLQKQHVDLASSAVRNGFDGDPDFAASAGELDKNSIALADAVGSVYGAEARDQFLAIWRSHIGFFVDYTTGAKAGDKAKMDQAVKNLNGYVEAISDFFSKANPNLPKEAVAQLVTEHVMLLKGAVDKYGAGDYAGSYAEQTKAYDQIGNIANAISGAIVKQKPDSFK